jgi:hypothetical protein
MLFLFVMPNWNNQRGSGRINHLWKARVGCAEVRSASIANDAPPSSAHPTRVNLADEEEIDAVVVRPAGGEAYLRASADCLSENNFNTIAHAEG